MRRAGLAALLAAVALGVIFDASEGEGSGPRLGIAYVRGGADSVPQVWLADPGGRHAQRLGPGTQPLLAPSGWTVAASAATRTGPALVLYGAGGGAPRGYFDAQRDTAASQAWSPDSRYLAVTLSSTNPLSDAASGLAVIDTQTSTYRVIAQGSIYGASFAPDGSDRLVWARAGSTAVSAPVDLHQSAADGTGSRSITQDGRSLFPVWGRTLIAFTHERLRRGAAPVYQIWRMRTDGGDRRALTHIRVPPLLNGLVPISFAGGGAWLLAEFQGQDTSQAWVISVGARQAREVRIQSADVSGSALSSNGASALVDAGGYLNPPDQGVVEALPLTGGAPKLLVPHGSQPSWNL
jgi:hypothetical protein